MVLGQFSFLDETDKEVLDDTSALFAAAKKWKTSNNDEGKRKTFIRYEAAPQTVDGEEKAIVNLRRSIGRHYPYVGNSAVELECNFSSYSNALKCLSCCNLSIS